MKYQRDGKRLKKFLEETGIRKGELAKSLGVVPNNISNILSGQRGMSVSTAIKMSRLYGNDVTYWSLVAEKRLTAAEDNLKSVKQSLGLTE